MKKVISGILIFALLFAVNVFALGSNEVTVPQELIKPNGLYSVDYSSELSKNISEAEIVVLGDYEFSTEITYKDYSSEGNLIKENNIVINSNKIKKSICDNSISAKKNKNEMKMIFVANNAIKDQCQEKNSKTLRTALKNGYTIFFECADVQTMNQISKNIFESTDNIFVEKKMDSENEVIKNDYAGEQKKSYFYVSKSKDNFTYFNIVEISYNGDQILFDRSILEHAWSNRNNINYLEDVESYKDTLRKEVQKNNIFITAKAAGYNDDTVLGVTFHGNWLQHRYIFSYTLEGYLPNWYSHVSFRMYSRWTYLLSEQLSGGKRIWANVSLTEVIPNNTSTTDRPFFVEDAWFWSEVYSPHATVKSYAPANAPKATTYNYGWEIGATGGIEGKTPSVNVNVGASFSKSLTTSNIEYYTNKYIETYYNGTTFQMAFDGNNNYTKNHSEHTSVTFSESSSTRNTVSFYNKMKYIIDGSNLIITNKTLESSWVGTTVTYDPTWSNYLLK